jgi:hypothetical protein
MALAFTPIITVGKAAYLNTLKDGIWKIVGLDWDTSEQIADITLPSTYRINTCSSSPAVAVHDQLPRRRASSLAVVLLALLGVALMQA